VTLEFPQTGGHAGFPGRRQWLARRALEFLASA
jgi:predicted alpha/beta-fold hydrolase